MDAGSSRIRADRVAAWAVGVGVGLIATMLTWLIGNRVAALAWESPVGPTIALMTAIATGMLATWIVGLRLDRSVRH
jgi:hypothetical protein